MGNHNIDWQEIRNENIERRNKAKLAEKASCLFLSLAVVGMIVVVIVNFLWALDKTAENQARYYSKPSVIQKRKPMSKMSSPTFEQMWALEQLNQVSRVAHAERQED